jgi:hypothetical protein
MLFLWDLCGCISIRKLRRHLRSLSNKNNKKNILDSGVYIPRLVQSPFPGPPVVLLCCKKTLNNSCHIVFDEEMNMYPKFVSLVSVPAAGISPRRHLSVSLDQNKQVLVRVCAGRPEQPSFDLSTKASHHLANAGLEEVQISRFPITFNIGNHK